MPLPDGGDSPESTAYDAGPQFDPYDPPTEADSVQPFSPSPSSTAPGDGDTQEQTDPSTDGPTGAAEEQQAGPEPEALPAFDERHREEFTGLLYLGRLQHNFGRYGHRFVVRTLTTEQFALIDQIIKPHLGGKAENAVYQTAVVAASVNLVDGRPLPGAITNDPAADLRVRYDYVARNWMPPVREAVYKECMALELVARRALAALGEASG